MLKSVAAQAKLPGAPSLLVDVSGSMTAPLSRRSEMLRTDAAYGLAVLLREIGERVKCTRSRTTWWRCRRVADSRLRDAIDKSQAHNGTYLGKAVED